MSAKTIWKFEMPVADETEVRLLAGAEVVDIQAAGPARLHIWAIVDPDADAARRRFSIRGTGHPLGDVGAHVATVQAPPFVWHVFEAADR